MVPYGTGNNSNDNGYFFSEVLTRVSTLHFTESVKPKNMHISLKKNIMFLAHHTHTYTHQHTHTHTCVGMQREECNRDER